MPGIYFFARKEMHKRRRNVCFSFKKQSAHCCPDTLEALCDAVERTGVEINKLYFIYSKGLWLKGWRGYETPMGRGVSADPIATIPLKSL